MSDSWRCFHCNSVFTDFMEAQNHFGRRVTDPPKCEDYLQMAHRALTEASRLRSELAQKATEVERAEGERDVLEANARVQAKLLADTGRERDALAAQVELAAALVAKLDEVHADPQYMTVWECHHHHFGPYTGANYETEFAALKAALTSTEQRS